MRSGGVLVLFLSLNILGICSGDGTLSVMDVRSKKTDPIAQSEDQEDELLSIVSIKGFVDFYFLFFIFFF